MKVGEKTYPTFIDEDGVQRFFQNSVICHLFEAGKLDLNQLAVDYHQKKFSQVDYAELNMMLGYSVSGWCDLSSFQDMKVINPLWEKREKKK